MGEPDYAALARTTARALFASMYPYPFLLGGASPLRPPLGPQATVFGRLDEAQARVRTVMPRTVTSARPGEGALLQAVRKRQDTFPSMITVGRTANNDLVLLDASVSRFHAWFQLDGDRLLLADAGSRNGTLVAARTLEPKVLTPVRMGERLRFGEVVVTLVDAGGCWDAIIAAG